MGYTASYLDNAVYGASDLNRTVSRLVSSGVADPFKDGLPYHVTRLNDIVCAVSKSGVVPDSVSTLRCVADSDAGTVHIAPGTAFFESGVVITLDAEGVTLPVVSGVKNYVYLKSDESANTAEPLCTTEPPSGDCVELAEISAQGIVTDRRRYARGKVPGYQSNAGTRMEVSDTVLLRRQGSGLTYTADYTLYLGVNDYRLVVSEISDPVENRYSILSHYHIDSDLIHSAGATVWGNGQSPFLDNRAFYLEKSEWLETVCGFTRQAEGLRLDIRRTYTYARTQETIEMPLSLTVL